MVRTYNQTNASSLGGFFDPDSGIQRQHAPVRQFLFIKEKRIH